LYLNGLYRYSITTGHFTYAKYNNNYNNYKVIICDKFYNTLSTY